MPTNLAIDDELLERARIIGKHKTKKAVVMEALNEYIERRNQQKITELFGIMVYEPGFDYKA
ncbi:MAG: type II toxin-antitoxin system VapB family antitoxin [Bacteroidetes bacterium]|nr:type II toxin-antitoxin system VapB family antitoxin [Bacteroidota bacterium]